MSSLNDQAGAGSSTAGRRRALAALVNGALAALGGTMAALLGGFAWRPRGAERTTRWRQAAALADLEIGVPHAATIAIPDTQGWYRSRSERLVYLVRTGADVRAFSATCSHLGCHVAWDPEAERFHCPCHGGEYDAEGQVVSGPPPRPLTRLETTLERNGESGIVKVRW